MGDVTALMMDVITEKSGHAVTPLAVSVCLTPAAPAPLPIPYPVFATSIEGHPVNVATGRVVDSAVDLRREDLRRARARLRLRR